RAGSARKQDFLAHRGSRLSDAQALSLRGLDWSREIAPAQAYLTACMKRESDEREEKEAALTREKERLAENAAAQRRTAQLQIRWRRTLIASTVAVVLFAAFGVWQYSTNLKRQSQLDRGKVNLLAELATSQGLRGHFDSALRLSLYATLLAFRL